MGAEMQKDRTKYGLNEALKELMRKKPLDQIRVRELTDLCGLRRQSFYYHFTDVYDLFAWSVRQERELLLRRQDRFLTWQQALKDLMRHAEEDRAYYLALRESRGRQGLWQVFGGALEDLLDKTTDYYQKRCGGIAAEREMTLRVRCGTVVLLALVEGWICGDLHQPTEAVGDLLETSMQQMAIGATWQNLPQWRQG